MSRITRSGAFVYARGAVAALALFLPASLAAPAAAAPPAGLPTQGVYDSCSPPESPDRCVSRLRLLSEAGFEVVQRMGVVQVADLPALLIYSNAAHALGMKVIWDLRPGMSDVSLAAVVAVLRLQPSTWGYYIFDEPKPADRDVVAAFAAKVKSLDPTHPRLVMGCGNCYGGEGSVSFLAGIDTALGSDVYPVWEQAPDQSIVTRRVEDVAGGLARVADAAGSQKVVALQAFRWGDSHYDSLATGIGQASRFPTRWEIEQQRNAAIAAGSPDLILWFTLNQVIGWEPGQRPWYWAEPSDPGVRWSNLTGGAFAPLPSSQPPAGATQNKPPVARFTFRSRRLKRARAARRGRTARAARRARRAVARVRLDARASYDPDGEIVRYRWYVAGRRRPICARRRCAVRLRNSRRRRVKLVVTDGHGARSVRVRRLARPQRRGR